MDVSSKLTLYDFLVILVPGVLIAAIISCCGGFCANIFVGCDVIKTTLFFVFSYIIGIVWNCLMEVSFRFFRNNEYMINQAFDEMFNGKSIKCRFLFILKLSIRSLKSKSKTNNKAVSLDEYYKCYYFVMKNTYTNAIPVLEGQVALLRNIILVIPLWGFVCIVKTFNSFVLKTTCCLCGMDIHLNILCGYAENICSSSIKMCYVVAIFFSIFLMVCLYVAMVYRQYKIYELVVCDYKYLYNFKRQGL